MNSDDVTLKTDPLSPQFDAAYSLRIATRGAREDVDQAEVAHHSSLEDWERHFMTTSPCLSREALERGADRLKMQRDPTKPEPAPKLAKGEERLRQIRRILKNAPHHDDAASTSSVKTLLDAATVPVVRKRIKTMLSKEHQGPMAALTRCVEERVRVRILVRGRAMVRRILNAYVVAFDSHWNLALRDVDETYVRSKKVAVFRQNRAGNEQQSGISVPDVLRYVSLDKHYKRNAELMSRHLNQVFLKGDNVVLISLLE